MEQTQLMELVKKLTEITKSFLDCEIVIFDKEIKEGKCSGYIYLPKEYSNKQCRIIVMLPKDENNKRDTERRGPDILPDEVLPKP